MVQPVHSTSYDKYQTILRKNEKKVAVRPNYYSKNRSNVELLMKVARYVFINKNIVNFIKNILKYTKTQF